MHIDAGGFLMLFLIGGVIGLVFMMFYKKGYNATTKVREIGCSAPARNETRDGRPLFRQAIVRLPAPRDRGKVASMKRILALLLLFASCSNGTTTQEKNGTPKETDAITAGTLKFDIPAEWKKVEPESRMRKAQYEVADKEGVRDPAEFIVINLKGFSGSMEDNLARWYGQVSGASQDKNPPEELKVGELSITMLDLEGTYSDQFTGNSSDNFRFLIAAVELKDGFYYIKLVGPKDTVDDWGSEFRGLIKSCRY